MTEQEKTEAREELERLKEEGKYTEFVIPDYEFSDRDRELDLLDSKCENWVKNKIGD